MTETLFFGFVFLCLVPLYQNVKKNMFFSPDTVFVFAFLLYRCTLPINFLFFGNDYGYSSDFVDFENILSILMVGSFLIAYNFPKSGMKVPVNSNFTDITSSRNISIILSIVGIVLYALFIVTVYGTPQKMYLVGDRVDLYKSKQGLGFLVIGRDILLFGLVIAFNRMMYLKKLDPKKNKLSVVLIVVILLFFAHNLLLGDRNPILDVLFGISVVFWLYYKGTRRIILVVSPILFLGFILLGALRGAPKNSDYITYITNSSNWANFDPTSKGELTAHFKIDHDVLYVSGGEYKLGGSYLEAFVSLVPKNLIAERPEYLTEWYARKFHREIFEAGGGFGFSLIAETYMNFGTLGMVLIGFFIGYFCKKMYGFVFNHLSLINLSIYGITLYYIFLLPRAGITPSIKPYLFSVVVPYYLLSVFFRKKDKVQMATV
jgi:oligosaccharide repeat unit polymerase